MERPVLLDVIGLKKHYPVRRGVWQQIVGAVRAVDGVTLHVDRGETLGLVGESGCGKSTLARTVVRLTTPTSGHVVFDGSDVHRLGARELRKLRPRLQMVFQNPYASLDPRMNVGATIGEPLQECTSLTRAERRARVLELMDIVRLDRGFLGRYPHEFSGGQRQRIGIARALAPNPELVICDEPISALDVSIQAQIINLLRDVQARFGLAYLFISHDLGMVRHVCDRVAVMYLGRIVEIGPADTVFRDPQHPYTKALLASVPIRDPRLRQTRAALSGEPPSQTAPPRGCRFHTRCPLVEPRCREEEPELRAAGVDHEAACHLIQSPGLAQGAAAT